MGRVKTRLCSELEETVGLERSVNELEADLKESKRAIKERRETITKLEAQLVDLEPEGAKQ